MENYGGVRQATGDNIVLCMCIACWITKATGTHSEFVILYLLLFVATNVMRRVAFMRTLPFLFISCAAVRCFYVSMPV